MRTVSGGAASITTRSVPPSVKLAAGAHTWPPPAPPAALHDTAVMAAGRTASTRGATYVTGGAPRAAPDVADNMLPNITRTGTASPSPGGAAPPTVVTLAYLHVPSARTIGTRGDRTNARPASGHFAGTPTPALLHTAPTDGRRAPGGITAAPRPPPATTLMPAHCNRGRLTVTFTPGSTTGPAPTLNVTRTVSGVSNMASFSSHGAQVVPSTPAGATKLQEAFTCPVAFTRVTAVGPAVPIKYPASGRGAPYDRLMAPGIVAPPNSGLALHAVSPACLSVRLALDQYHTVALQYTTMVVKFMTLALNAMPAGDVDNLVLL